MTKISEINDVTSPMYLARILTYKRSAWTLSEKVAIRKFIDTIKGMKKDDFGNRYIVIGKKKPRVAFCCHTDTVHHGSSGMQLVMYNKKKGIFFKNDNECLGADDGTGMWICLNLINAKVPGLYIFHRAEEIGGRGSDYIVNRTPELLKGIEMAIAFDRRGKTNVLTHQGGRRCCSDEWATQFAEQLNKVKGLNYSPDDTGVFTDTANYIELVPECTNISVGYQSEHSGSEKQDIEHLQLLRDALVQTDYDALKVVRDPNVADYKGAGTYYDRRKNRSGTSYTSSLSKESNYWKKDKGQTTLDPLTVGAKVKLKKQNSGFKPGTYTIDDIDDKFVKFKGYKNRLLVKNLDMEVSEEKEKVTKSRPVFKNGKLVKPVDEEFKVGDKVVIIKTHGPLKEGDKFTIAKLTKSTIAFADNDTTYSRTMMEPYMSLDLDEDDTTIILDKHGNVLTDEADMSLANAVEIMYPNGKPQILTVGDAVMYKGEDYVVENIDHKHVYLKKGNVTVLVQLGSAVDIDIIEPPENGNTESTVEEGIRAPHVG